MSTLSPDSASGRTGTAGRALPSVIPIRTASPLPSFALLPSPRHLDRHAGVCTLPSHGTIVLRAVSGQAIAGQEKKADQQGVPRQAGTAASPAAASPTPRQALFWARQVQDDLAAVGLPGWQTWVDGNGTAPGDILLILGPRDGTRTDGLAGTDGHTETASEAYTLETRPSAPYCTITASDTEGLRDGLQTLRQLVRSAGPVLPVLRIDDRPALAVRGYSLDVSRGRIPTRRTLLRLIDLLELCKYTQLQLYVESAVAFPQTEQAWHGSTPLTFDDLRWLDDQCALRGLELVPELACFGHMYDILRTPRWRHLGEHPEQADRPFSFVERMFHHTLNPADPHSIAFVDGLIDDYAPLFRSHWFNIGCDETFDLGTGASAALARRIGVPRLYAGFVAQICDHVRAVGSTPIMYADIALRHPDLLGLLPAGAVLANWDYAARPDIGTVAAVAASGHRQIVCPGVQTWNRLLPDVDAAWSNISRFCKAGQENGVLGMLVTDWGDFGHINDPLISLPGLAFAAECSWAAEPHHRDEVERAASRLLFGDPTGTIVGLLAQAARCRLFGWDDAVRWSELDAGEGRANPDVLSALGQPASQADDLAAARATFRAAHPLTLQEVAAADARLGAVSGRLGDLRVDRADTGAAADAAAGVSAGISAATIDTLRLMIEGQKILNHLGLSLCAQSPNQGGGDTDSQDQMQRDRQDTDIWHTGSTRSCADDPQDTDPRHGLARRIRTWTQAYTQRWFAVSRPSRLGDIVSVLRGFSQMFDEQGGRRS